MILYHGTNANFEQFDESFMGLNPDRASNGHLGVWCAREREVASRFGTNVLTLEVAITKMFDVTVSELLHWHQKASDLENASRFYAELRHSILNDGHSIIRVLEHDGRADMFIVLDISSIQVLSKESLS